MDNEINTIKKNLEETKASLDAAEQMASEHGHRHSELTSLASRSNDLLDTIKERSEEVIKLETRDSIIIIKHVVYYRCNNKLNKRKKLHREQNKKLIIVSILFPN